MSNQPTGCRFSLASLLVVTAVVAVILGAMFVFPWWVSLPMLCLLTFAAPALLLTAAIQGRGDLRAFAVGAMVPTMIMAFWTGLFYVQSTYDEDFTDIVEARLLFWIAELAALAIGLLVGPLCIAVRRMLQKREVLCERGDG